MQEIVAFVNFALAFISTFAALIAYASGRDWQWYAYISLLNAVMLSYS